MTAILLPSGRLRYHAYINGAYGPAVGYKLYTYEAGTTTPKATYSDSDAATALANPIVLDALGECAPYGTGAYKLTLTDPDDAVIWTQDNVTLSGDYLDAEWCGTAGGTVNALTLNPAAAATEYSSGLRLSFIAAAANTGAVTVSVSGLAAKAVTWNGNTALVSGDLVLGRVYQIQYDGTRFQLMAMPHLVAASSTSDATKRVATSEWVQAVLTARNATETATGLVELATEAEFLAGTDPARVLTPKLARDNNLVSQTAKASTSGTEVDFTGIPAWAKRITGMLSGVSNAGGNLVLLQIGDGGGIETSGYEATASSGAGPAVDSTAHFTLVANTTASGKANGHFTLTKISGNQWVFSAVTTGYNGLVGTVSAGSKTLSATLDRIRILNAAADTFDAGSINIFYE